MGKHVVIQFPGLGGYVPGVLADLVAHNSQAGAVLAEIDQVAAEYNLGPVSGPLSDPAGPAIEELAQTPTLLHLASFASGYLLYQALREKRIAGDVLLGQSTGEITALAAAGSLTVSDAARVLCEREVALDGVRILGGLVAVRAGAARARRLCGAAGGWSLTVSLSNSPEQSVISGIEQDLPRLEAVARAAGVHATRLLVRYPHHNPALRPAARRVAAATAAFSIVDPVERVYSPILGRFVVAACDARRIVDRHLTDPVDYLGAIRVLYDEFGVREFLEVGARSVLTESARESLPATVELRGAPPNALAAEQILDALAGQQVPQAPVRATSPINGSAEQTPEPSSHLVPPAPRNTAAAGAVGLPERSELLARLRVTFAAALGYPEDVFTDEAHLEADLGIASVKKTELLVRLLDEYRLPTPPAQLRMRDYTTLPKLAGLMEQLAAEQVSA
ncbi:acyltransferase domain-containing protein [Nocardia suismassiliense]|uniref:acyltransferase domain-containing protein n=1 Tax=Nocardia suismassiliense TaxID=2077092 RepID=UPI000D1FBDFC|nr:acyltransferase domain-containing protein [Nocardia suismassiliense]